MNSIRLAAWSVVVCLGLVNIVRAERVLLSVGSSQGLSDEWPLAYAVADAERFARVMVELGDVAPANARVLKDPTVPELLAALREAVSAAGKNATFILYYSGHGSDAALHVRGERLPSSLLRAEIAQTSAVLQLLIVDACRGTLARKGFARAEPFTISLAPSLEHTGLVVLHAAGDGEAALESNRLRAGVFSHFLLSGLRGAADADSDGRVSLYEAYDYAFRGTLETSASSAADLQHPSLDVDMRGAGPLVLTRVLPARSTLKLPAAREAQYLVFEKGSGASYTEAWARADRPTLVALPAGQFVVYRRTKQGYGALEVSLPFGGERQVAQGDFAPTRQDESTRRGGRYTRFEHSVVMSAGLLVDGAGRLGSGASVTYGYHALGFVPVMNLGFTSRAYWSELYRVDRYSLDVSPGVEYRTLLGRLSVALGVNVTASLLLQQLETRSDQATPDVRSSALGLGGGLRARLGFPLSNRFGWHVEALGTTTFFRERQAATSVGAGTIHAEFKALVTSGPALAF